MLVEEPCASARIRPRAVGAGCRQYFEPVARSIDRDQPETDQPTKAMNPRVAVAAAAAQGHGEPHLIRRTHPVDRLQQQIEIEAPLYFDDHDQWRLVTTHR